MLLLLCAQSLVGWCRASDPAETRFFTQEISVDQWSDRLIEAEAKERVEILIRRGEAYRSQGHYLKAASDFQQALQVARAEHDPFFEAVAKQALGYVMFLRGNSHRAESMLRCALQKAKTLDRPRLTAVCANRLANVLFARDHEKEARSLYTISLDQAIRTGDAGLEARVRLNLVRLSSKQETAVRQLRKARRAACSVSSPEGRVWLLLAVAAETRKSWTDDKGVFFAHTCLNEAFSLALHTGSKRLLSLSAGRLGELYEHRARFEEARGLTEQALTAAQALRAHELLLQWEHQLGRIMQARGRPEKALAAYRRAVFHIQSIRQDIPVSYQGGSSSFRETLAPVFFGLADLLLQHSARETDEQTRQELLREARDTVEHIKRSEIRDYFNDPCVDARTREVKTLSPHTAVVYPIMLKDRLEVLVDAGGRLHRKTSPVSRKKLERAAKALAHALRNPSFGPTYQKPARNIFDWLIGPVESVLETYEIRTLVYVPDGALRLVPAAALWDGHRFLAERYAVATVPGLTLLDPNPLPREDLLAMLAGLSRPGPVVKELPHKLWKKLSRMNPGRLDRGVRGLTTVVEELSSAKKSVGKTAQDHEAMKRVQQALALPGVEQEIERLSEELKGHVLLDNAFELEDFLADFRENDYQLVHIASHGFFGGEPEQNFIMTYDRLLNMNQLESMIKPKQLAAHPVELIVLSACQTAEGDDRSPLGLTGMALKSGARSGLGSLWPVSDNAVRKLLPDFYAHLKKPQNSKAKALQQAQLDLMQQEDYSHPFFWSPFILVGNWL